MRSHLLALVVALLCLCTLHVVDARPLARAEPDVVPASLALGPADEYYKYWCGGDLTYLEDSKCAKVFPSSFNREWVSPLRVSSAPPASEGWARDTGSFANVRINHTLTPLIGAAKVCVIMIRRLPGPQGPDTVYYKYLCGAGDDKEAVEPWSSSKIYAAANAGGNIRLHCPNSGAGLPSSTTGKHGVTPLGDLVTVIASYDSTAGYTSNGLSSYMHDLGDRLRINALVQQWFGPAGMTNNSLGGNYGMLTPTDLGFVLDGGKCVAPNTPRPSPIIPNFLSMAAHVELLRRLALFSDVVPSSRFPGMTLEDAREILYGARESKLFPGLRWGGMSADIGIFVQSGVDMAQIEKQSQGQWRIHSKMGSGWSSDRRRGEMLSATYAAWPVLDPQTGEAVPDQGLEFIIVGQASVPEDANLRKAENVLQTAIANVVKAMVKGQL